MCGGERKRERACLRVGRSICSERGGGDKLRGRSGRCGCTAFGCCTDVALIENTVIIGIGPGLSAIVWRKLLRGAGEE